MPSNPKSRQAVGPGVYPDRHRRSREVISPSGGIMRCKFPSLKNGRLVHCEGLLELDAVYLFEAHRRIVRYREQPARHHYADGDRTRRYTPDFELTFIDGSTLLVEIKPERSLAADEVRQTLQAVRAHMRRSGHPFVVLTDAELRLEPRQSNVRSIFRRAGRHWPTLRAAKVDLSRQLARLPMLLQEAEAAFKASGSTNVYTLLLLGLLRCDQSLPLQPSTVIHLSQEYDDELFCFAQERHV